MLISQLARSSSIADAYIHKAQRDYWFLLRRLTAKVFLRLQSKLKKESSDFVRPLHLAEVEKPMERINPCQFLIPVRPLEEATNSGHRKSPRCDLYSSCMS